MLNQRANVLLLTLASVCVGASAPSSAATSEFCPGQDGYFHTNYRSENDRTFQKNPVAGGFVSNTAFVDSSVWLGPEAAVCDFANVDSGARITGNAVIRGEAFVAGSGVMVTGRAILEGDVVAESYDRSKRISIRGSAFLDSGVLTPGTYEQTATTIEAAKRRASELVVNGFNYDEKRMLEAGNEWVWTSSAYQIGQDPCKIMIRQEHKNYNRDLKWKAVGFSAVMKVRPPGRFGTREYKGQPFYLNATDLSSGEAYRIRRSDNGRVETSLRGMDAYAFHRSPADAERFQNALEELARTCLFPEVWTPN